MSSLHSDILALLRAGHNKAVDSIKLLLYKENPTIFESIDFENNKIYTEPHLYSYYNFERSNQYTIDHLLLGYYNNKVKKKLKIAKETQCHYLPNIGWIVNEKSKDLLIKFDINGKLIKVDDFEVIPPQYICNNEIEVYQFYPNFMAPLFYNETQEDVSIDVKVITKKHLIVLDKAYRYIKKFVPKHYELIQHYSSRCLVFDDTTLTTNSFASIAAYGIGFYNAYQEDYDEVFFVDDIAHQTGHNLMFSIGRDPAWLMKIDPMTIVDVAIDDGHENIEGRHIEIVLHALFTYYTSFVCLDACIQNNAFSEIQKLDAFGRIKLYLWRCDYDLNVLKSLNIDLEAKESSVLTKNGHVLVQMIQAQYLIMKTEYGDKVENFTLAGQDYNFSRKVFLENNQSLLASI